jgi:hypothetical protein
MPPVPEPPDAVSVRGEPTDPDVEEFVMARAACGTPAKVNTTAGLVARE